MKYIRVKWKQSNPQYPVLLYSELDPEGWEQRKVEIFTDGHTGYASENETRGDTRLGDLPVPSLSSIAKDTQFEPETITKGEFEEVWLKAVKSK
jgi:hypothetical protein